jgi:hypothetical protein
MDRALSAFMHIFKPLYEFHLGWLVDFCKGPRTLGDYIATIWTAVLFYLAFCVAFAPVPSKRDVAPSSNAPFVSLDLQA